MLLFAVPALAQESNWSGVYVGLSAGYSQGKEKGTVNLGGDQMSGQIKIMGNLFGAQLGYNYEFRNKFVLGLEGDMGKGNVARSETTDSTGTRPVEELDVPNITSKTTTQLNWLNTNRLRLGYSLGRFLPYVTGGGAYGSVKTTADMNGGGVGVTINSKIKQSATGYALGAGLEYAVSRKYRIKVEYLYTELRMTRASVASSYDGVSSQISIGEDLMSDMVRISVARHF
ncbi:MAG: outer membrane beta-barrel protein [bacterium]|nr:outer membrane beta-barrel protein [bacterium]